MLLLILFGTTTQLAPNDNAFTVVPMPDNVFCTAPFPDPVAPNDKAFTTAPFPAPVTRSESDSSVSATHINDQKPKKKLAVSTFGVPNKKGNKIEINLPERKNTFKNITKLTFLVEKYIKEYQIPRDELKEGCRYKLASDHPNLCLLFFAFLTTISAIPGMVLASEYPKYVSYCIYITAAVTFVIQVLNYLFFYPITKMGNFDKTREKFDKNIAAHLLNFCKSDQHIIIGWLNDIFEYNQEFTEKLKYVSALIKPSLIGKYGLHAIRPLPNPDEDKSKSENDDDDDDDDDTKKTTT